MADQSLARLPHRCALKHQAVYQELTRAERKAADYLPTCPEQIRDLSIVAFANKAGCSEATIVRLSKHIG